MFLGGCVGIFGNYETPAYTVATKDGAIEVRDYSAYLAAETDVEGSRDEAINKGFSILADYIFGNNISREKIAMTAPVTNSTQNEKIKMTAPVLQKANGTDETDNLWTVRFMIPSKYTLETLPVPKNTRVRLIKIAPARKLAVTFSGSWNPATFDKQEQKLRDYARQNNLRVKEGPAERAFYNPPFTLPFLRRNEILIPAQD